MTKASSERLGLVVARIRAQAAEFVTRDGDVRAGRDDAIHAMRVATRRLRSCLRTFRGAFDGLPARHLGDELAWIGEILGAARDAQVIAARIADEPVLGQRGDHSDGGPERDALLAAMATPRYQALVVELATFAISPPLAADAKGRRWMVRKLRREIERTVERVDWADALDAAERDGALHEARKAAKRVRYAAETLEPGYGKRARRIARVFETIQVTLGDHHDAIVLRQVLEGLVETDVGPLIDAERARAAEAEEQFTAAWRHVANVLARHWPMT